MQSYKRRLNFFLHQFSIGLYFAEGVAHHFMFAIGVQSRQIKFCQKNPFFFLSGNQNPVIPVAVFVPDNGAESTGTAHSLPRRVCHHNSCHVLIGTGGKSIEPVGHFRAIVWDQNNFGALHHQDAGAFRVFPIITNHQAELDSLEVRNIKLVPAFQHPLFGKVAGVYLAVFEKNFSVAVNEKRCVVGPAAAFGITGYHHADFHFPGSFLKS